MQNNLVSEIQKLVEGRKLADADIPMPTYLYIQRYGRRLEKEMEEIAQLMGETQYFTFKAGRTLKENTILRGFLMELEKNALVGKDFSGCVLVELPEVEEREELSDFLDYLSGQKQIKCIFTIHANQSEEKMCQLLEQYFFVRVLEGQKYDCGEQVALIESVFHTYGLESDSEAMKAFEEFFAEWEWEESDMVENLVQNIARNLVYEKRMEASEDAQRITADDAGNIIQKMQRTAIRRSAIGFFCD